MLRIAFITDTMDGLGGGVVSAVRFVRALRRRHLVTVVAAGDAPDIDVHLAGFQLPLRAMREMRFVFARPERHLLERAIGGADLVHLQMPFWLSFAALGVARRLGVPAVAGFHVQPENLLHNAGVRWRWLRDRLYRFWISRYYRHADAVIAPSPFAERRLRQHGLTGPVHVISNGVHPRLARPRLRLVGDRLLVLAVGRLAREKRQDVIIDAVARSRHAARIQLVLAGSGPLEPELVARARALPRPAEIGWVSEERLAELYRDADLLVHAGEVELEGMAVLDAVGVGLPALVADAPESAAAQLAAGPELLFRPGDPAHLAERMDAFLDAPERLGEARRRAAELARAFSLERSVDRLEAAYHATLRREAPPAAAWLRSPAA
jgi:glycosyltransferase involved in cell wall biosynthesis